MRLTARRWLALPLIALAASLALPQLELRLVLHGHQWPIGSILAMLLSALAWLMCWYEDKEHLPPDQQLGLWYRLWVRLTAYHVQAATYLGLGLSLIGQPSASGLYYLLSEPLGAHEAITLARCVGYLFMGFSWLLLVSRLGPLEFILLQLPFGLYTVTALVLALYGITTFNILIVYQAFLAQGLLAILGHHINHTITGRLAQLRGEVAALTTELQELSDGPTIPS